MDDKLKQILGGCEILMLKYGLRNISMDDISRELGISKKTLYHYVANKTELIEIMMMNHLDNDWQRIINTIQPGLNAIDIILNVSKMVCEHTKEINPKVSFEMQKYYPEVFRKFTEVQRSHILQGITLNIEQGKKEGLFREDVSTDVAALLYVQNVLNIHMIDISKFPGLSFEKLHGFMFENHIRGIVNKKGLEYFEKHKDKIPDCLNG